MKLDIDIFRHKFNAIFWDSIWYFNLKDLDYDFFLPYEYELNLEDFNKINSHLMIEKCGGDLNIALKDENSTYRKFFESYPNANVNVRDSIVTCHFNITKRNTKFSVTNQINLEILNENNSTQLPLYLHKSSNDSFNVIDEKKMTNIESEMLNFINTSLIQDIRTDTIRKESTDSEIDRMRESNEDLITTLKTIREEHEYTTNNLSLINNIEIKDLDVKAQNEKLLNDVELKIEEIVIINQNDNIEENKEYK